MTLNCDLVHFNPPINCRGGIEGALQVIFQAAPGSEILSFARMDFFDKLLVRVRIIAQ